MVLIGYFIWRSRIVNYMGMRKDILNVYIYFLIVSWECVCFVKVFRIIFCNIIICNEFYYVKVLKFFYLKEV